jgi:hypothetical protein
VAEWKAYPNPAQNQLFVVGTGIEQVRVLNVLGQEVLHLSQLTSFRKEIGTASLPNGIYWLEMKGTEGVKKVKLVIRR